MTSNRKYIYRFGGDLNEGNRTMKNLLGGKGANLAEMSSIGLPVPPGFTISADACKLFTEKEKQWPNGFRLKVDKGIAHIEKNTGNQFGEVDNPLLISVRSGAAVSMPGMMDTVLNLGLNRKTVDALAKKTGNKRFAVDCYRRFIQMFGNVVMHIPNKEFEGIFDQYKSEKDAISGADLTTDCFENLVERYKNVYEENTGHKFIEDPNEQLRLAIQAVFESWYNPRAKTYRRINGITGLEGTAVTVQAMVFGNMGPKSATGVCFTRSPSDGTDQLYGEFLINAQGEDVVAGTRTPENLIELKNVMPDQYDELLKLSKKLENHYKNMQDIEFTIQENRLFVLQTRDGKRTGKAAIKIAVDMVEDQIITKKDAVEKIVEPIHLEQLLHPQLETNRIEENEILGKGLPASPGAAVGKVVFSSVKAEEVAQNGDPVILVRTETSPEDVAGMSVAEGILTSRGGMTSHASVVARGWGKPCISGCNDILINYQTKSFTNGEVAIHEGEWISLDGNKGLVIRGQKKVDLPSLDSDYHLFMEWVDQFKKMKVRANADTLDEAVRSRLLGAEGIGLCRTEHMFFDENRIKTVQKMILSEDRETRKEALDELLPYQKQDFLSIFSEMQGLPVTVRLLDPPLHEFLPEEDGIADLAKELNLATEELANKIKKHKESNPMLGHRGCRLGITFPEITMMQTRAILEAAVELTEDGKTILPEIMVPLIGTSEEFINQMNHIKKTAEKIFEEYGCRVDFKIGTMIEVPRATLIADKIAPDVDFFSFGTNDLTQMTYGYSRDDASKFLNLYIKKGILQNDPFEVLDIDGTGQLISLAVNKGRNVKPDLKIGICGEHGGEPTSIRFFNKQGFDYVSCSSFRIPIARLTAAQESIKEIATEPSPV